jgi:membrane-associated phospholipid phosphatase
LKRNAIVQLALLAALLVPVTAHAEPLHWDERRPRFRTIEYIVTGVLGPVAIGEYFFVPAQKEAHWVGGILFDDAARDALRLRSPRALQTSWAVADGMGVTLIGLSIGLDSIIVPLARGSPGVAWQLLMMDAESFTLSSIVVTTLYDTVGRARPAYEDCKNGASTIACTGTMTASFPSGHINEAFTAAGLSCAHHLWAHVYGNRFADIFACSRDLGLATTEALLRVMGERHWMSDVVVGSAVGFAFGFGLPTLLHYTRWGRRVSLVPMAGPQQAGVIMGGVW